MKKKTETEFERWMREGPRPGAFRDAVEGYLTARNYIRPEGEYYHDLDLKTNLWCVFHTEHAKAVASFADEGQSKEEADKRNRPGDK